MDNEKVFNMSFAKVFPMLITKAEKKGRTKQEVYDVTTWLTGYTECQIDASLESDITYGDFFKNAPWMNSDRENIKGSICGVKIENISDPLMQNIRRLDKMVDDLAKGKPMEKIIGKA